MFEKFQFSALVNGVARKWLVTAGLFASLAGICAAGAQAAVATGVASSPYYNCAVTSVGGVMCWGFNYYGQLGNVTNADSAQPVATYIPSSNIVAVTTGGYHSCALTTGQTVKCWGNNSYGQLGDGTTTKRTYPVDVLGLTGVIAISNGYLHTCALLANGNVKCWGLNGSGQLGNGTNITALTPISVSGVSGAIGIGTGYQHSCAVLSNKTIQCWGANNSGQLGNSTVVGAFTRVNVMGLSDATSVTVGLAHTCANTTSGSPKCWGDNSYGQVGDGTFTSTALPTPVTGLNSGVASIVTSGTSYSTCAVLTSGEAKCWGNNAVGQLGNGNRLGQNIPVSVVGLSGSARAIAIGYNSACALVPSGLQCWGDNAYGELGFGSITPPITFPVNVFGFGSAPLKVRM